MDNLEPADDKVRIPINVEWKVEPQEHTDVRHLIMLLDRGHLIDHNIDKMYRCGDPACSIPHKGLKALMIHAVVCHNTPPTEPVAIRVPPKKKEPPMPKSFWDRLKDLQGD